MHKTAAQRVRSGLLSIIVGRPLSAIAGVLTLILLSRSLPPEAYASYFALWAAVEIVVLASNGGLMHAAYRYVQGRESASDQRFSVYGPVPLLLGLRLLSLPIGIGLFCLLPTAVFGPTDPAQRQLLLLAFVWVCLTEGLARYCELVFESLLLQVKAQRTVLLRALVKPLGIVGFMAAGPLHLEQVLLVEVVACGLAALVALLSLWRVLRRAEAHRLKTSNDEPITWPRVRRFVLPAFLTQLLGLSYGPDVLKLVLNGGSDAAALATFGFAFSLAAMVQRYLPVIILGGLFRPLFVAAAARGDADLTLARLISVVNKLNWFVLALPLVALAPCAAQLTALISKGNYPDAGPVLLILLIGSAMVGLHGVLSLYCLAREQSRAPLMATVLAACSLPLAVWLARQHGASGLALGWGLSEAVWVLACLALLYRGREFPRVDWLHVLRVPMFALLVAALGFCLGHWRADWAWIGALLAPLMLLCMCRWSGVFDPAELEWFRSVAPPRLQSLFSRFIR